MEMVESRFRQDSCLAEKNKIFVDEVRFNFPKSCCVTDKRARTFSPADEMKRCATHAGLPMDAGEIILIVRG